MCNPALIGLALMAAGTAASYEGQRQGAKAARKVASKEDAYQQGLRKKSLAAASETVDKSTPQALAADIAASQSTVGTEQGNAAAIAKAAMQTGAPGEVGGQIYDAAVADAGRAVRPMATRQGFSQGIENQGSALAQLAQNNLFISEDSRRSLATLQSRLARAGRRGSGWRTAGKLLNMGGGAMTSYGMYAPATSGAGAPAAAGPTNTSTGYVSPLLTGP